MIDDLGRKPREDIVDCFKLLSKTEEARKTVEGVKGGGVFAEDRYEHFLSTSWNKMSRCRF